MKFKKLAALSALLGLLIIGAMHSGVRNVHAAGPWFVDAGTGNDANDCLSAVTACKTIQGAVNKTSSGDTVNVAAGTYTENVVIPRPLTLNGAQAGIDARGRSASESIVMPTNPAVATSFLA